MAGFAHRALVGALAAVAVLVPAAPAGAIIDGTNAAASGSTVLLKIEKAKGSSICTGTLVARSVVLTAAHCVEDPVRVRVLTGLLDREAKPAPAGDFIVTKIQESRDFDKGSKTTKPNDLAYLELGRDTGITPSSISYSTPKAGATAQTRGYGSTAENADGSIPEGGRGQFLKEGLTKIVTCPKGSYADVFCSDYSKSNPKVGPCRGDSGGPLLSAALGKLVGVYSGTGKGCKGVSDYAHLALHKEFITETLSPRITGRVFDDLKRTVAEAAGARPDDARIAGKVAKAVVKARDQKGKLASSTPIVAGRFTLPVKKGTYDLEVVAPGFKTLFVDNVTVNFPRALDAGLVPGTSAPTGKVSCPGGVNPDGSPGDFYSKITAQNVTCDEALAQTKAYVIAADSGFQKIRTVRGYQCEGEGVNGTLVVRCEKSGGQVVGFVGQS